MRVFPRLLSILTFAVCLSAGGRAIAQQTPQSSAEVALLQQYTLPAVASPAGYVPVSLQEVSNTDEARLRDRASVPNLVSRGRIDGIEQDLGPADASLSLIEVTIALYRDAAGAQADLAETAVDRGFALTPSPPALGDTSVAGTFSADFTGSQLQEQLFGFTSGRLLVFVQGLAINESMPPDVLPVAARLAQQAAGLPAPAPTSTELAVLQTETSPESILHDAYRLLVSRYLTSLSPATVLGSAYTDAAAAASAAGGANLPAAPQITSSTPEGAWAQFLPAFQQLETTEGSSGATALAYAAATGMYGHLNCHNEFFTPTGYARELAGLSGSPYVGIGITQSLNPPNLILKVQSGTPADQAGLRPGDQIIAVDHMQLAQLPPNAADALFRGVAGSPITLTIQRAGTQDPFDVTLVRQAITPQIELHKILPGGIGYIELDQFVDGDKAVDGVRSALQDFAAAGNVSGWILDLRFDGGGNERTMQEIADFFVPEGSPLVSHVRRDGSQTSLRSDAAPLPNEKPLVILVGPGTASAAEIFTEALRDLGVAQVIGSQTAGCVNGGNVFGLLNGSGVFVSTEAFLAGPHRLALEGVGVTPDQSVPLSLADFAAGNDAQLTAAIAALSAAPASH